jgi:CheY-like chemotaxis protein
VTVADNGRGIEPELAARIFDMFAQARPGQGLGLGLTIVKRLTEMHGGTVDVRSQPGKGSELMVRLPVLEDQPAAPAPEGAGREGARSLVVALIDDNEDVRLTTKDLLEDLGHRVETAEDGEQGLALILRLLPDVALVDIGLPVLDGHGVAQRVRAAPGGQRVRLLAMSGYGAESDRSRSREAGFDQHLVKPCDLDTLIKALGSED